MALNQRSQARLSQNLVLTPALQQAIKLLPMSTVELVDLLTQEVVENPMLEEIPNEELQPAEAANQPDKTEPPAPDKDQTDSWEDADYD